MEKLRIYQTALFLVKEIYDLIWNNPKLRSDFSLNDQLKRASISPVANIAEGYCRTKKQNKYYLMIASGSANETVSLLQVVSLIYHLDTKILQDKYQILGKQINKFSQNLQ